MFLVEWTLIVAGILTAISFTVVGIWVALVEFAMWRGRRRKARRALA